MARNPLFTDVYETDTFNEWRLKTNSIKLNLADVYAEIDNFPNIAVMLTGNQTVDGIKSFAKKSVWTKEYTQNQVTPMLELRVTNSTTPYGQNIGHKGSGPSIDFYNPDTTTGPNTWLTSRIASITESNADILPDASLVFYTGKNTKDIIEKMRITSGGNIGIGTTSPTTQLSITTATNNSVVSIRSKDDKYAGVSFGDSKSDKSGQIQYHNIGNSMRFLTGEASSNSSAERLRITSSGNVGIGTGAPSEKLDVVGNLKTTGFIEAGRETGGVALTLNDGYGNSNIAFNHSYGKASVNGSSGRIRCDVDSDSALMQFELGDNTIKDSVIPLSPIVTLTTSKVTLNRDTDIAGNLYTSGKIGIRESDPDWDLCVGNKTTEAGHVAMHADGGVISLRPKKNTTHGWLINAYDQSGGSMGVVSRKWNSAKNAYDETVVLDFNSNNSVNVRSKLAVGGFTNSSNGAPSSTKFSVRGSSDDTVSAQFGGTIQVNQLSGSSRAYAFLSTNLGSAMVGGNLRFNGTEYEKGTNQRGSAAIELIEGHNSTGQIVFLRANDTNDANYSVTESGRFDENGRFGIGVTNPTQALDVSGNIKSSGLMFLANNGYPQLVLSDANQQTKRFGIWKENTQDQLAIGPQTTTGSGTPAIRIHRNATVDILKGGKVNVVLSDAKALVNKEYVDNAVAAGDQFGSLSNLVLNRVDNDSEGGQLTFKRATDNTDYWHVDTYGNTNSPSLRFFHENDTLSGTTQVLNLTSTNKVGIRESDPDWDLCVGGKSTEAGSVAISATGGAINLRPTRNTTHAWMLNASDSAGGGFAVVSRELNAATNKYIDSTALSFYTNKNIVARGAFTATSTIRSNGNIIADLHLYSRNDAILGKSGDEWRLHSRTGRGGDFFEIARRNDANTDWNWGQGIRQTKDGSVGIGKLPAAGYKLDVNGSIQVNGTITKEGSITPSPFDGGLTTSDIYSDGGTIGVGKKGSIECFFNHDGKGYVKNRLTLGYTPSSKTDAVTKGYVDSVIETSISGNAFQAKGNITHAEGVKNSVITPSSNEIPSGVGKYSHGRNFIAKLESTNASDGGGLFIDITDTNNDEHALSIYNTNTTVNKEVFHIRSETGDTYSAGNFYAAGNIGAGEKFTLGTNRTKYWSLDNSVNDTTFTITRRTSAGSKTSLTFLESAQVSLEKEGTTDKHLVTKKYVDNKVLEARSDIGDYLITSGAAYVTSYTNTTSGFNDAKNHFYVYPPSGYTMANLQAFIPSIHVIHFDGGVDSNDSIKCTWKKTSDAVKVNVQGTEQRSKPAANWLAVWSR
jgi:hypothetical protein